MRTQETNSPGVQFGGQVVDRGVGPACRDSPLSSASLAGLWASFSSPDHNISVNLMALTGVHMCEMLRTLLGPLPCEWIILVIVICFVKL